MIYNIFCSSIYNKLQSIFKSKYQYFCNENIGIYRGKETRISGYLIGMHTDLRMQKFLQAPISYAEFISIPTNNKFTKAVEYIYDNKSLESCYVLLKKKS